MRTKQTTNERDETMLTILAFISRVISAITDPCCRLDPPSSPMTTTTQATGLQAYYPEMNEDKPAAQIEAILAHHGLHFLLESEIKLKGRGIRFIRTLTTNDLTPPAQYRIGWHEYKVTIKAFYKICRKHRVACAVRL